MMEIKYTNGEVIVINLFKNSITKKFLETYGNNSNTMYSITDCNENWTKMDYSGRINSMDKIQYHWSQILEGLDGMELVGNKVNLKFPNEFDFNQETLNTLHRIFTYCDLYHSGLIDYYPYCDNYTTNIEISFEEYHSIIDKINQGVHSLEKWVNPTTNRNYVTENTPFSVIKYETNPLPTFEKLWCEFTDEEYVENYNFLSYDVDNIVTLTDTILGKSCLNSFLDDDNPLLPDCTGRYATDGSFNINKTKELINLYNSKYFTEWTNKYDKTPNELPLELAIGYVDTNRTTKDLDYFFNKDLILEKILMCDD